MNYPDDDSVPAEHGDAEQIADEQFVHGLLETARLDNERTKRQRMARVVAGIGGDASHLTVASGKGLLDRPGLRRAVGFLTVAAAVTVVAIFLAITDRRSPADVVASLSRIRAVDQQWVYSAIADGGENLAGEWSFGGQGERLLQAAVWDGPALKKSGRGCLVLRTSEHSVVARSDGERPSEFREWPAWLRSGRLAAPLHSPHEWLVATTKTHSFAFDGPQHIVGTRRDEVTDSLVPDRLDVWLREDGNLSRLDLGWSPVAIQTADGKRSSDKSLKALKWFVGLDTNRDDSVDRAEAGEGWPGLAAMGFEDVQSVSKCEFTATIKALTGRVATELLFECPDTTRSQPPRQLTFKASPVGDRPTWLFEMEVFRRR